MIKRDLYMQKIKAFMGTDLIKIITGMRRSGKSVMLELIKEELTKQGAAREQFISINFEDMDNADLRAASNLHAFLSEKIENSGDGKAYLFLDEIQEAEDWQRCINSIRVKFDADIYITGSNAKLLSGELATYLAGRYAEFVIYPFSLGEFMLLAKVDNVQEAFKKYMTFGGMPFLANLNFAPEACRQYLGDIYNSVILKDIINRHNIRDVDLLGRIITYVMSNIGRTFSAASIAKYFKSEGRKAAPETVLNYIRACENAFLFYTAKRHDLVGKKILTINEKYYAADHALREVVCKNNNADIELILENIVFLELLRRGYDVTVGKIGEKEVDFVAQKDEQRLYIQVCYILAHHNTAREFSPLEAINDNYEKLVLSTDTLFNFDLRGIKHRNIADFLLG